MSLKNGNNLSGDAYRFHPRQFQGSQLVYPVLSRRSGGISLGVNLNPDKVCNFNCLYCQVQRSDKTAGKAIEFSLTKLQDELRQLLDIISSGQIYQYPPFDKLPENLRQFKDIALSGDGEPTAGKDFLPACQLAAQIKDERSLNQVKIILITNSSMLHLPNVQEGLEVLDKHQGEIWAKLDAGTEEYFQFINQTHVPLQRILDNILLTARKRAIVIQTLLCRFEGQPTPDGEIEALADRLREILDNGGRISAVQLHTMARLPRDKRIGNLTPGELDRFAELISRRVKIPIQKYYG
jgi:wyosine [tRNA(Phe)-imidazoG37] synthetase (radical SAM superfamily)